MLTAKKNFTEGITSAKSLFTIYDYLLNSIHLPHEDITDLLRAQIVYSISALDRFIHELVRIGTLEIFEYKRIATQKFNAQQFKGQTILNIKKFLETQPIPTSPDELPSVIINKEIIEKLSFLSFQAPDKIKDALSLIWNEQNKLTILAKQMGLPGNNDNDKKQLLEQTLLLIATRRNQIVHEADIDSTTGKRRVIDRDNVEDSINFIENLGYAIYDVVISPNCYIK